MAGLVIGLPVATALLALLAACCVRAVLAGAKTSPDGAEQPPPVDPEAANGYAAHLARMLRCETPSNTGDGPSPRFAALRAVLEECYPRTHAACERTLFDDAQLLRWPGRDPARGAILLMAHLDVMPAPGNWKHPPFGGVVESGRIWGRGAIDDKGALCAIYEAVEALIGEGFVPPCDVYLVSSDNEEIMGDGAIKIRDWLLARGVSFEIIVHEGGAVGESPLPGLPGLYALLGAVEKGVGNFRFIARSAGGARQRAPQKHPGGPPCRLCG